MLSVLRISGFALIDELELDLGPGLTVITGETGAGKSIIVEALGSPPPRPARFEGIERLPQRVERMPADPVRVRDYISRHGG